MIFGLLLGLVSSKLLLRRDRVPVWLALSGSMLMSIATCSVEENALPLARSKLRLKNVLELPLPFPAPASTSSCGVASVELELPNLPDYGLCEAWITGYHLCETFDHNIIINIVVEKG
jgi:hypothetical protein